MFIKADFIDRFMYDFQSHSELGVHKKFYATIKDRNINRNDVPIFICKFMGSGMNKSLANKLKNMHINEVDKGRTIMQLSLLLNLYECILDANVSLNFHNERPLSNIDKNTLVARGIELLLMLAIKYEFSVDELDTELNKLLNEIFAGRCSE